MILCFYIFVFLKNKKSFLKSSRPSLPLKKESFEFLRLPLAKGSSTSNQAFLLRRKDVTALLGARNRYALRLADHQRSSPSFAGWDRMRHKQ